LLGGALEAASQGVSTPNKLGMKGIGLGNEIGSVSV
jgi:hypothetical protein